MVSRTFSLLLLAVVALSVVAVSVSANETEIWSSSGCTGTPDGQTTWSNGVCSSITLKGTTVFFIATCNGQSVSTQLFSDSACMTAENAQQFSGAADTCLSSPTASILTTCTTTSVLSGATTLIIVSSALIAALSMLAATLHKVV